MSIRKKLSPILIFIIAGSNMLYAQDISDNHVVQDIDSKSNDKDQQQGNIEESKEREQEFGIIQPLFLATEENEADTYQEDIEESPLSMPENINSIPENIKFKVGAQANLGRFLTQKAPNKDVTPIAGKVSLGFDLDLTEQVQWATEAGVLYNQVVGSNPYNIYPHISGGLNIGFTRQHGMSFNVGVFGLSSAYPFVNAAYTLQLSPAFRLSIGTQYDFGNMISAKDKVNISSTNQLITKSPTDLAPDMEMARFGVARPAMQNRSSLTNKFKNQAFAGSSLNSLKKKPSLTGLTALQAAKRKKNKSVSEITPEDIVEQRVSDFEKKPPIAALNKMLNKVVSDMAKDAPAGVEKKYIMNEDTIRKLYDEMFGLYKYVQDSMVYVDFAMKNMELCQEFSSEIELLNANAYALIRTYLESTEFKELKEEFAELSLDINELKELKALPENGVDKELKALPENGVDKLKLSIEKLNQAINYLLNTTYLQQQNAAQLHQSLDVLQDLSRKQGQKIDKLEQITKSAEEEFILYEDLKYVLGQVAPSKVENFVEQFNKIDEQMLNSEISYAEGQLLREALKIQYSNLVKYLAMYHQQRQMQDLKDKLDTSLKAVDKNFTAIEEKLKTSDDNGSGWSFMLKIEYKFNTQEKIYNDSNELLSIDI